jgi:hypothetical protein
MKRSVSSDTMSDFNRVTLEKILTIEKEVMELKLFVLRKLGPTRKNIVKLKGIVSDVEITEEDIAVAKSTLYDKTKT